jgi:hypothetical protein
MRTAINKSRISSGREGRNDAAKACYELAVKQVTCAGMYTSNTTSFLLGYSPLLLVLDGYLRVRVERRDR